VCRVSVVVSARSFEVRTSSTAECGLREVDVLAETK